MDSMSLLKEQVKELLRDDPSGGSNLLKTLRECQTIILKQMETVARTSTKCSNDDDSSKKKGPASNNSSAGSDSDETYLIAIHPPRTKPIQPSSTPACSVIPIEALHQICQSDFLSVQELGRLLLCVRKSFIQELGHERTWELLCCKQWKNTPKVPKTILQTRGYEWLFRQQEHQQRDDSSRLGKIGPPVLTLDTLTLMISIRNNDNEEVVSLALQGDLLHKLICNGELNVPLPNPISLGSSPVDEAEGMAGIDIGFDRFCTDFLHWKASLYLLRTDQCQCASVHETVVCSWGEYDYCEDPNLPDVPKETPANLGGSLDLYHLGTLPAVNYMAEGKPPPVEVDMGYLEFSGSTTGLEFTIMGQALLERIRDRETCYHSSEDRLEAIKLEPTLLCFTQDFSESSKSVELAFSELRLDIWKTYRSGAAMLFHSQYESTKKQHGVTLLHLLDHLAGWQDDDVAE